MTGVDAIVNEATARRLGLVRNVAVLVNAPAADMTKLAAQVSAVLGKQSRVVRLVPVIAGTSAAGRRAPAHGQAGQLPGAVPGVRRAVLPGAVLDGAGRDRADRER